MQPGSQIYVSIDRFLLAIIRAYVQFFKIDILIFERSKGTERKKKIYWPRIEPVSRQNKFESGPFSALSLALTKQ